MDGDLVPVFGESDGCCWAADTFADYGDLEGCHCFVETGKVVSLLGNEVVMKAVHWRTSSWVRTGSYLYSVIRL